MSDSHLPCHAHAMLRPCRSSQGHGRARVPRETVGYLPAFGFFRLPRGVPRKLLSDAYQSQMQVASVKPNNVCHGRGKYITNKRICYTVGLAVRIFPATMRTFTKDTALSKHGRGAAWHVRMNVRHGSGTAWALHAMCESALNRPLVTDE